MWCYLRTSATPRSSLLSTKVAYHLSWTIFYILVSWQTNLPSFTSYSFLFFFKLGMKSRPVTGGEGGGKEERDWGFGASLQDDPLFLPTRRSFKPFLELSDISSSSSSELSSNFKSMRPGLQTPKILSTRPPGLICGWQDPPAPPSLPRVGIGLFPHRMISVRKQFLPSKLLLQGRQVEEAAKLGTTSSRARNLGTKTSILHSRGSPTLIAWPTS